jgi:Family of unknown function (DUF5330)
MGMIRNLVIVGAAIGFMPSPPQGDNVAAPQTIGAFAYMAAAAEAVADVRSFCLRNENVCVTASAVAQTMEGKAKYSAKLVYEWANEGKNESPQVNVPEDTAEAMSTPPSAKRLLNAQVSQNTLTVTDLVKPWRKPKDYHPKG